MEVLWFPPTNRAACAIMRPLNVIVSGLPNVRFFFSGELDTEVSDSYRNVRKEVEDKLNAVLAGETYGGVVKKIAIIPMILRPVFAQDRKERRLVKRTEGVADYRLFVDYEAFQRGTSQQRKRPLLQNVLTSIADIHRKLKGQFDGESLRRDVLRLFPDAVDLCAEPAGRPPL